MEKGIDRNTKIIRISIQGILVNLVLVLFKAAVGFLSGSIAIILDAINNLSDMLSSLITILGTALSNKKPDKKHPFGHGRVEYFSSLIIAIIVLAAGAVSLKESVEKILHPASAKHTPAGLLIIIVAVFVKYFFGRYVKKQGEELNSGSLIASGTDAISDAVLSFSTFTAALILYLSALDLEGWMGLVISAMILKTAVEILMNTVDDMIGVRADRDLTVSLRHEIGEYEEVQGVYDLTVHNYGPGRSIATAHIQVADEMTAGELHRLTRTIELDIYQKLGIILTLGIYAANDGKEYQHMRSYLVSVLKNYPSILQMHGFYVDETSKVISFDLIFDFSYEKTEEAIEEIRQAMEKKYPGYQILIIQDSDISD